MKKTISNFHCSNHGYVDFTPKCSICVKELETSIRKEVAQEEKERWVKIFDYHNDLASGRHTFYREAARVEIEYWDKFIKE